MARAPTQAASPQQHQVADFTVLDALEQFLPGFAMAHHQSHADLEVLLVGLLRQSEHLLRGGRVHGHGFLHENVQPLLDGVAEMHPTEGRGRGEDGDVPGFQTIQGLLVSVESQEPAVGRDIHALARLAL